MRRRAVSVIVFSAMLAVLLVAATGSAQAATFVTTQNLGRRQVAHSAGSALWLSSSQVQYGDTNGNFLTDSERGRCAVLEQSGIARVRITSCNLQQKVDTNGNSVPDTWVNKLINPNDHVDESYAVSATPSQRFCFANSALTRTTRDLNYHVVRRLSDGALFYRTTPSSEVQARALAGDPGCKSLTDLSVAKTFVDIQDPEGGDVVGPIAPVDDTFQYRITVTNMNNPTDPNDGGTATDVTLADDYPADLDNPVPGPGCVIDINAGGEQNVVCKKAWLESGDSVTFVITARTNGTTGAAVDENIASLVELEQADPNLDNNSDSVAFNTTP